MVRSSQMERCDLRVVTLFASGGADKVPERTITDDDLRMVGVDPKIIRCLAKADPATRAELYDLAVAELMSAPKP